MARERRTTSKAKAMRIDFSGVPEERRQRSRHIPPGEYAAKIVSWKKKYKDDDKSNVPYLQWTIQVSDGKYKGVPLYENTSLKKDALFNLRNLIYAASDGKSNVAGKTVDFNPDSLVGKKICIIVEDNEYNNSIRSQIADLRPLSEMEDEDEDQELDEEDEEDDEENDHDEDEDDEEEEEEDEDDLDEVDVEEI